MGRPTLARSLDAAGFVLVISVTLLIHFLLCVAAGPQANEKPTTVSSRGFLSKFLLSSATCSHGIAYDDHRQQNLSNNRIHAIQRNSARRGWSSRDSRPSEQRRIPHLALNAFRTPDRLKNIEAGSRTHVFTHFPLSFRVEGKSRERSQSAAPVV